MAGTLKLLASPAYIANAAANIYTPAGGSALIFDVVRHIHVANRTGGAVTFSLYVGASAGSAAGTELFGTVSVAANATLDYYCSLRLTSTTFLSGIASAATSLVITVEGEQGVI